jgi:hypothetical protein
MRRAPLALALLALLAAAAPARAQAPAETLGEVVREQSCRTLLGGTVNAPDVAVPARAGTLPSAWPAAPAGLLPREVLLRTERETFNRLYEWATRCGEIYAHVRGDAGPWRRMPLPPCFAGRVAGISADDDELVALDGGRHIYTLDNALKDPALFTWSSRWGTPFWTGLGYALPDGIAAWTWSVISPAEDRTWQDPAGNHPAVGTFKVSHIWGLRTGGQRLTFWDPWLPLDESYEACGPQRGRFRAVALSGSGSHLAVLGAHGDLFTRLYDFDISGHDPVFFSYAYEDQRGKGAAAKIQLPAEPWARQPKIPGEITSAVSIHKTGQGAIHAIRRVEGRREGRTGFWERDIADPPAAGWRFRATGLPLTRPRVDNPAGDTSLWDLGRAEDRRYVMDDGTRHAVLEDFNVYCSPARLTVREGATTRTFVLHHLDGIRQQVRGRGLDETPRTQTGAIEGPPGHFEPVTLRATREEILLEERGWRLRVDTDDPPLTARRCLPASSRAADRRAIGAVALGARTADLLAALPAPTRRDARGRGLRWCLAGGGRLGVALARGRVVLVRQARGGGRRPLVIATRATKASPRLLRTRLRDAAR